MSHRYLSIRGKRIEKAPRIWSVLSWQRSCSTAAQKEVTRGKQLDSGVNENRVVQQSSFRVMQSLLS